jgi:hypothetical protein
MQVKPQKEVQVKPQKEVQKEQPIQKEKPVEKPSVLLFAALPASPFAVLLALLFVFVA